MRFYYKVVIFNIICISFLVYEVLLKSTGTGTVLNPTWFTIAFSFAGISSIIQLFFLIPVIVVDNDEERRNLLEAFDGQINFWFTVFPFLVSSVFFIQFGVLWSSIVSIIFLVFNLASYYSLKECDIYFIKKEARAGTPK